MAKYRSKVSYKEIYESDKQGFNLGLDGAIFLKQETTPRQFIAPSIGTQGKSTSAAAPSTDISGGTDVNLRVSVDGGAVVAVGLTAAGASTGVAIAAELETKINAALLTAGQDARVWVEFAGGLYVVSSQSTGTTSAVVITDGLTLNVADDLKLGVPNAGAEVAGTDDTDFLLYTSGGPKYMQGIESNSHRSGRFHAGVVKAKKMAEWSLSTYVNMGGTAGASIDPAVKLLWKSLLGTEEVVASTRIRYTQGTPNTYMSMVRVSTIFGEYYTGAYVKDMNMTFPGDGPATCEWSGKAATRSIAGIALVDGVVTASSSVVVATGQAKRYTVGAPVMLMAVDGRTILYGADGALRVSSITLGSDTLVLSAAVTLADGSYVVPWNPGAVQQTGRDNIYTDLEGSFKIQAAMPGICATNIGLNFVNDHVDRDNCFGAEYNEGFIPGNRLTATLSVTFDLNSEENLADVIQSEVFAGFSPELILGAVSGRHMKITAPKWIPAVPPIEVPESGTTPVTLEGILYQSVPGARDPIVVDFL